MNATLMTLTLAFALWCSASLAQTGPEVPCTGCTGAAHFSAPRSGWWYNPEQSGTGLNLEFQNGLLVGSYYGFNPDGSAQWWVFAGVLEVDVTAPTFTLRMTAPLQKYVDGACFGCPYRFPDADPAEQRTITLTFPQQHHGTFRIGDQAEAQFIVPLISGVLAYNHYQQVANYPFPEVGGHWAFVFENVTTTDKSRIQSYSFFLGNIRTRTRDGGIVDRIRSTISTQEAPGVSQVPGQLECLRPLEDDLSFGIPECTVRLAWFFPGTTTDVITFAVPLANIGAFEMSGFNEEEGVRFRAFRITYDGSF